MPFRESWCIFEDCYELSALIKDEREVRITFKKHQHHFTSRGKGWKWLEVNVNGWESDFRLWNQRLELRCFTFSPNISASHLLGLDIYFEWLKCMLEEDVVFPTSWRMLLQHPPRLIAVLWILLPFHCVEIWILIRLRLVDHSRELLKSLMLNCLQLQGLLCRFLAWLLDEQKVNDEVDDAKSSMALGRGIF